MLLTTFDGANRQVAHQEVPVEDIFRQVEALGVPLVGCPLWRNAPYAEQIGEALRHIQVSHWTTPLLSHSLGFSLSPSRLVPVQVCAMTQWKLQVSHRNKPYTGTKPTLDFS